MRIHLLKNNSENNKLGKNTTYIEALDGTLRAGTSLLNPIFEISLDNYLNLEGLLDITYPDDDNDIDIMYVDDDENIDIDAYTDNFSIFDVNYVYIEEFKRYYFVKDINVINAKLFILSCECDVLDSHKDELLELDALIERNEFLYNDLLEDNLSSYNYNKDIRILDFDTHPDIYTQFRTDLNIGSDSYFANNIIWSRMSGGYDINRNSQGFTGELVSPAMQGYAKGDLLYSLNSVDDLEAIVKSYVNNDVKLTYLKHLTIYPFKPKYLGEQHHGAIAINPGVSYETVNYRDVDIVTESIEVGKFIFSKFKSYMDFSPYTKYEVYVPYYGYVELNAEDLSFSTIVVEYDVNYFTGEEIAKIVCYDFNNAKKRLLFSSAVELGTKIPLNSTNSYEIEKEKDALKISTALGVVSSTMQIALGWASYNPMMMASGGMGLASTLGTALSKANQFYVSGKIDMSKAVFNNFNPLLPHLKVTKLVKNNNNDNFIKYYGKPLNEVHNLSTLHGFTKVVDIHLENVSALDGEKSAIESLLKTGIII